jgi:SAM-dependent methyltransferase
VIDYFSLGHPLSGLRSHYAIKARKRMFGLFMEAFHPSAETRVLDLGVTPDTSLPEANLFERLYPYPGKLTAASIEDAQSVETSFPGVRFVKLAGGPLPFADREFDIVFCSAVIEHVGDRESQRKFIAEALRVGKGFFFTTPHRYFPLEFHTLLPLIHWLPQPAHQALLRKMGKDFWAKTENLNLLTLGELRALFPACGELRGRLVRLFGWPSNIVVYGRV